MERSGSNKGFNIAMVLLIVVIVVCGIMAVGHIKGWFDKDGNSVIISRQITGVVHIQRDGVGYSLKEKVGLKPGDTVETKSGAEAEFTVSGKNELALNENTELTVSAAVRDDAKVTLNQGEIFADVPKAPKNFEVAFGGNRAVVAGAVFSVSNRQGSAALNVYRGEVQVMAEDGSKQTVQAGKTLSIVGSGDGKPEVTEASLAEDSLSAFVIHQAKSCDSKDGLCFTQTALQKVLDERAAEKKQARQEKRQAISAAGEGGGSASPGSAGSSSASSGSAGGKVMSCTVSIRCDAILDNMGKLDPGKRKYVPANGVILAASAVEFTKGETVFDVLQRACAYTGIQMEYAYTPAYGSYYIEGINHLYEFDCGSQSGWKYKVNGWAPNYGCSEYAVKNGDNIVWSYTCNDL